jgi:hypothetical protein
MAARPDLIVGSLRRPTRRIRVTYIIGIATVLNHGGDRVVWCFRIVVLSVQSLNEH